MSFEHQRHKPATDLQHPRPLVLAIPPLHSNVNLSRIVRVAGCCGVRRIVACGTPKIDETIARDAAGYVKLEVRRTLLPALKKLRGESFRLVGLEQATNSRSLFDYQFQRQTALVIGHERTGLDDDVLRLLDDVVEIPVFGLPHSYNVASATAMALYEYCRQFPQG